AEVTESNGLGWSPDGGTFYFIDSGEPRPRIRAFPFDLDSGTVGPARDLVQPPAGHGIPDGLVVDAEGCLWVAFWGGHTVRRYSPAGELLAELPVPVSQPSCPAFGGPAGRGTPGRARAADPVRRRGRPAAQHLLRVGQGFSGQATAGQATAGQATAGQAGAEQAGGAGVAAGCQGSSSAPTPEMAPGMSAWSRTQPAIRSSSGPVAADSACPNPGSIHSSLGSWAAPYSRWP